MSPSSAPLVSKYTYRLHARAAVLEGLMTGVLLTYDVVARKSLDASQQQITMLTMAPGASWLLSVFVAHRIAEVERRSLFLWAGILGRLPLLAMAAVHGPGPFLIILILQSLVQTALIPAQNALYQANYDPTFRGRLFGRASVYGGASTALSALLTGWLMDHSPEAYQWLYPCAGLAGFGACLVYGTIRLRRIGGRAAPPPPPAAAAAASAPGTLRLPWTATLEGVRSTFRVTLIDHPGFRRFEVALWIYGVGFMCMQPVFARLFVDELDMNYQQSGFARGVVFYAVNILALAIAGKMHDRVGLEILSARGCVVLAVFAAAMAWVTTPVQAIAAYALFGFGMGAVGIAWSMGPIRYAPPGEATRFMAVHIFLVGVRAVVGHPLGGWLAGVSNSSRPVFALASLFFVLATLLMIRAHRIGQTEQAAAGGHRDAVAA